MKNAIRLTNSKNKIMLVMGDCLKVMKEIPDSSVDLVLCDLPMVLQPLTGIKFLISRNSGNTTKELSKIMESFAYLAFSLLLLCL